MDVLFFTVRYMFSQRMNLTLPRFFDILDLWLREAYLLWQMWGTHLWQNSSPTWWPSICLAPGFRKRRFSLDLQRSLPRALGGIGHHPAAAWVRVCAGRDWSAALWTRTTVDDVELWWRPFWWRWRWRGGCGGRGSRRNGGLTDDNASSNSRWDNNSKLDYKLYNIEFIHSLHFVIKSLHCVYMYIYLDIRGRVEKSRE